MRGRATPVIEVSMMTMNWAAANRARAHRAWTGAALASQPLPTSYLYGVYVAREYTPQGYHLKRGLHVQLPAGRMPKT